MKLDANNTNAWYNKGIILFKMCRYQDALNSFAQAADIDPGFTDAWYNKGMAFMNIRKYLEAIRAFDKVLKLNPHDRRAREQRDLAQKKIMESCSFSETFPKNQTKLI
jgi:tetratricopeptide (TPR) repeat protein